MSPEGEGSESEAPRGRPIGRRVVLAMLGLGAVGIVVGSKVQRGLEWALAPIISRDGGFLAGLLPVSRFRIYSVTGTTPVRDETTWRLAVGGEVDKPFELDLAGLRSMAPTQLTRDFQCVTGWRVPDVAWAGVRVSDLLDQAGVKPGSAGVRFYSYDCLYT
ncbi:MAG: molybdopterin-dependent oxidoreductase, partial [Pseudonocardiaceae bacterium]